MQGTEHDIAFFLALRCAADFPPLSNNVENQTERSPFLGTVLPVFTPKRFKTQGGMLAIFWCCASGCHTQNV